MKLSLRQQRVLKMAIRSIGGHLTLNNHYNRLAARALDRKGLGHFGKSDYGAWFRINDAGKSAAPK